MLRLWDEKRMVKVTEQRLVDQAGTILKRKWFTTVELEEIKRNKHRNCDEQSGTGAQEAQVQSKWPDEALRQMS